MNRLASSVYWRSHFSVLRVFDNLIAQFKRPGNSALAAAMICDCVFNGYFGSSFLNSWRKNSGSKRLIHAFVRRLTVATQLEARIIFVRFGSDQGWPNFFSHITPSPPVRASILSWSRTLAPPWPTTFANLP